MPVKASAHGVRLEATGALELGEEIACALDGAGDQLREIGNESEEIDPMSLRLQPAAVDVHRVGDGLEGVEAEPDGQDDI